MTRERWRRISRVVGLSLTGFSVLTTVATLGAWRYAASSSGRARLAAITQRQLVATIPGLRIAELGRDLGAGGDLIATNVDLWDSDGRRAVHVDRLRVRPHWTSLLHRTVHIEELRIEGARILARPAGGDAGTGPLNLTTLMGARPTAAPKAAKTGNSGDHLPIPVRIDRLVIADAAADVWTGGDGRRIVVRNLALEGHVDSVGRRTSAAVAQLSASVTIDERTVSVAAAIHGRVDERAIEAIVDSLRITGVTPTGEVALRAGATGERGNLKVWLTGTGPDSTAVAASGGVALGEHGVDRYDARLSADVPSLRALLPDAPTAGLSLRVQARGTGTPLQPGSRVAATLYVPSSTVAGHTIDAVFVQASSEGAAWRLERADARAPGVVVHAEASGTGPQMRARLALDVRDMAAARRTAGLHKKAAPAVPGRGAGHLDATLDGRTDGGGQVAFAVTGRARALNATAWGRLAALDLSVRGTAKHRDDWTVTAKGSGRVNGLDGPSVALGTANFQIAASVDGTGAQALQTANVTFDGTALRVGTSTFDRLDLRARADRTAIALSASAAGRSGSAVVAAHGHRRPDRIDVTIDRLDLALAAPGPRQQLALAQPASLIVRPEQDIQVSNLDVRAKGDLLSGQATVAAMARLARPPAGTPWGRADVTLDKLTTAGIPPVTGSVHAVADGRRARTQVDLKMGASRFSADVDVPAPIKTSLADLRLSRQGQLSVALDTKNLDLASLPPLQRALSRYGLVGGRITVQAKITGDMTQPDAKLALDVRSLELRDVTGDGRDAVIHTIPGIGASVQIDTAADKIQTSGKLFMYSAGVASFSGSLGAGLGALLAGTDARQAALSVRVDVPRFQINALKSLSDELRDTRGWLAGSATVNGTLAHPRGQAQLAVTDVQVDRLTVGRVVVHATTDGRDLHADAAIERGGTTGALTANAHISLGPVRTVDARVQAKQFNPGLLRPFLTGVRELDGVVDADVRATGTMADPRLDGRLYAYRGRVGVVGQPTFRDVGLAVSMRPGRIELEKLQMYSGDGSLDAKGWMTLDGMRPRGGVITGNAHRFTIAAAGVSGARLDGAWAVEIAQRDSVLGGTIDIPHAALWLPKLALGGRKPQKITQHDDVQFVDGASRAADARKVAESGGHGTTGKPPLTVNMKGKARTVYVRGKDMDLELESTVTLKTPPTGNGPLQLLGSVRFRRGRINIQGQRFDVGTGAITFDGPPSTPYVDINLSHTYPDARINVEVRGRPAKPELRLSSEPPIYDQGQIVSLILTGQAQGRPGSGGGSFDPTATIATAVLRKLADKVAPEIGLDVIRIERGKAPDDTSTTAAGDFAGRVEVGKYVNDRVYVSYAHRFGATELQNSNEAHAEYRMSAHWLAETVFGDAGVGGVDAFWIHRY